MEPQLFQRRQRHPEPPTIGEFRNGRGEFFSQETIGGRAVLVRFVISDISDSTLHYEQAFSDDGGKTWEVNCDRHPGEGIARPAREELAATMLDRLLHARLRLLGEKLLFKDRRWCCGARKLRAR